LVLGLLAGFGTVAATAQRCENYPDCGYGHCCPPPAATPDPDNVASWWRAVIDFILSPLRFVRDVAGIVDTVVDVLRTVVGIFI
jgi:hypothetical protein